MRSSASGVGLGGSSLIGSHPSGGEPGGEIRKFFVGDGGAKWYGLRFRVPSCSNSVSGEIIGVGFPR
jgi:hypothetical protein